MISGLFFCTIAEQTMAGPRMDIPAPERLLAVLVVSAPAILPRGGIKRLNWTRSRISAPFAHVLAGSGSSNRTWATSFLRSHLMYSQRFSDPSDMEQYSRLQPRFRRPSSGRATTLATNFSTVIPKLEAEACSATSSAPTSIIVRISAGSVSPIGAFGKRPTPPF